MPSEKNLYTHIDLAFAHLKDARRTALMLGDQSLALMLESMMQDLLAAHAEVDYA